MNKYSEKFRKISPSDMFTLRHIGIMLGTAALCFLGMLLVTRLGAFASKVKLDEMIIFALISIFVSTIFSLVFIRKPLKSFDHVLDSLNKIAQGDYSVRVNVSGHRMMKEFNSSFNHMASELASVEILRNDFVNNFSHEFKTPIVSICGFAKMLQRDDLSPEERREYLDIIISESNRLTELSTNVLNLSRLENKHILANKKDVNISEQIRLAVALLEKKWSKKKIDVQFDSEEIYIHADDELLKQVWINLIDNAIKFSPEYGTVSIKAEQDAAQTAVCVINEGEISGEAAAHIFDKFYQKDLSHNERGNGLGLTIAQKITELHEGSLTLRQDVPGQIIFQALF